MRLDLFLALRFLLEGWRQSALLVLAAAVGVSVLFFLTALITAVESTMVSQTLDVVPHVVVTRPKAESRVSLVTNGFVIRQRIQPPEQRLQSISNWPRIVERVEGLPGVEAVSPALSGAAFARSGAASRSVTLLGVDPKRYSRVVAIQGKVVSGDLSLGGDEVAIGVELAEDLGLTIGDRVSVSIRTEEPHVLRVRATVDLGTEALNERWMMLSLRRAQAMLGVPGGVTTLDVRSTDLWLASSLARRIEGSTGLSAVPWTTSNAQLEVAIRSQRGATLMIRIFVMLAVAMGIASVLIVSTVQKSKQIGILRAMGFSRRLIQRVFLLQGALIGIAGAALGIGVGVALSAASMAGSVNPDGSPTYPIELPASLFAAALSVSVVAGVAAAYAPAARAAKLDPATAIRHD